MKIARLVAIGLFGFVMLPATKADALCITFPNFCDHFDLAEQKGQEGGQLLYGEWVNNDCAGGTSLATGKQQLLQRADLNATVPGIQWLIELDMKSLLFSNYKWDGTTFSRFRSNLPFEVSDTCPAGADVRADLPSTAE